MAPGLSYDDLKALGPCTDSMKRVANLMGGARKWNGRKVTAEQARAAGATFDDIVWAASAVARTDKDAERRLRLWAADCAARVLHIYEHDHADDRPRGAIIAARQYARGEISAAAMDAAWAAAWDAAWAAARAAAWAAARAGWAAARAARAAARAAEQAWQYDRLIMWLSDAEPDEWPLPAPPTDAECVSHA